MDNEERIIEALERAEMDNGWDAPEPEPKPAFVIDSDEKAEWALKKIKDAQEEHDRLIALVDAEQERLNERRNMIDLALDRDTDFLRSQLAAYMRTVKCKATKTQESYQLLTGKLVRKIPSVEFEVDNDALAKWLGENGREDLLNVSVKPKWGEFKKLVTGDAESGAVVIAATGEAVDGIKAVESHEKFSIKFN